MIGKKRSRLLLGAAAISTGVPGELFSSTLFWFGVSLDGVLVFQMLFIGLILLGFYIALGEIPQEEGATQSPPAPTPRSSSTETSSARVEGLRTYFGRSSTDRIFELIVIIVTIVIFVLWVAVEYSAYGLLSVFPEDTVDYTVSLLRSTSFVAGMLLAEVTACLRIGKDIHHHTMVKASSVVLILTALLWAVAQRIAYAILLEYLGYVEPSDYTALAQLSSVALLLIACIGSLFLGLALYLGRPGRPGIVDPTHKPA